jgi:hypothetical protein
VSIETQIKLQPFRVPNFVLVESKAGTRPEGYGTEVPKYSLSDLSEFTLHILCSKFREDVFEKAGKEDSYDR